MLEFDENLVGVRELEDRLLFNLKQINWNLYLRLLRAVIILLLCHLFLNHQLQILSLLLSKQN